jgi:hypothetical protein
LASDDEDGYGPSKYDLDLTYTAVSFDLKSSANAAYLPSDDEEEHNVYGSFFAGPGGSGANSPDTPRATQLDTPMATPQDTRGPEDSEEKAGTECDAAADPKYKWIYRWLELMSMPSGSLQDEQISKWVVEFEEVCTRDGKRIIEQLIRQHTQIPQDKLSKLLNVQETASTGQPRGPMEDIPIANVGGIAGGVKFIYQGILYKLAMDPEVSKGTFLYGGKYPDYGWAAKAAAHELHGANAYLETFFKHGLQHKLTVPIMSIVDHLGLRIVAMPLLPLKDAELVYGTCDAGKTMHNSSDAFYEVMRAAAKELHLAEHNSGGKRLCSAADVEGHISGDGKMFLLDLARTFPPEDPREVRHINFLGGAVYFRLLRPELLRLLKQEGKDPLNPDTFSSFADKGDGHAEVASATQCLLLNVISKLVQHLEGLLEPFTFREYWDFVLASNPQLSAEKLNSQEEVASFVAVREQFLQRTAQPFIASEVARRCDEIIASRFPSFIRADHPARWSSARDPAFLENESISAKFHKFGVNMRHLGLVCLKVKHTGLKVRLVVEMVARVVKQLGRKILKRFPLHLGPSAMKQLLKLVTEPEPLEEEAADLLWKRVNGELQRRFGYLALLASQTPEALPGPTHPVSESTPGKEGRKERRKDEEEEEEEGDPIFAFRQKVFPAPTNGYTDLDAKVPGFEELFGKQAGLEQTVSAWLKSNGEDKIRAQIKPHTQKLKDLVLAGLACDDNGRTAARIKNMTFPSVIRARHLLYQTKECDTKRALADRLEAVRALCQSILRSDPANTDAARMKDLCERASRAIAGDPFVLSALLATEIVDDVLRMGLESAFQGDTSTLINAAFALGEGCHQLLKRALSLYKRSHLTLPSTISSQQAKIVGSLMQVPIVRRGVVAG